MGRKRKAKTLHTQTGRSITGRTKTATVYAVVKPAETLAFHKTKSPKPLQSGGGNLVGRLAKKEYNHESSSADLATTRLNARPKEEPRRNYI